MQGASVTEAVGSGLVSGVALTPFAAIVGSGLAVGGSAGINRAKMRNTVLAWAGSFLLAFGVGYGAVWALA